MVLPELLVGLSQGVREKCASSQKTLQIQRHSTVEYKSLSRKTYSGFCVCTVITEKANVHSLFLNQDLRLPVQKRA